MGSPTPEDTAGQGTMRPRAQKHRYCGHPQMLRGRTRGPEAPACAPVQKNRAVGGSQPELLMDSVKQKERLVRPKDAV